nr:PH domain-containing protein [Nocardia higoensis]
MLLVHPVTQVVKFIPVLFGTLLVGTSSGNPLWSLIPLVAIVGLALTRWFTTTYRVGPTHVELRTGLLRRRTLSVPRSRIRSVDIEADLLHRLLDLAVVVVGTGQQADSGEKFRLDSLSARIAPALRAELLAHTAAGDTAAGDTAPAATHGALAAAPGSGGREIGHWQPGWVRYAPLSLTGFAVIAPLLALPFQLGFSEFSVAADTPHRFEEHAVLVVSGLVSAFLLAVVALVSIAACGRYLATYFGLRVVDDGRTLHSSHGLFTRRQITLDLARFRGATVNEPLLLRRAGAAELEAIMVGENPRQKILPQAPRAAVERTLGELLGSRQLASAPGGAQPPGHTATDRSVTVDSAADAIAQLSAPLAPHGPAARRRRWVRAVVPAAVPSVALLALTAFGAFYPGWLWLPAVTLIALAVPLAEDRYRGLGHTVLPRTAHGPAWLITRSGSLDRDRDCLEAPGIVGWTVRQTFWQRRSGIATVVAATAAGKKSYRIIDVPLERAWEIIEAATPGSLGHR